MEKLFHVLANVGVRETNHVTGWKPSDTKNKFYAKITLPVIIVGASKDYQYEICYVNLCIKLTIINQGF